MSKIIRIILNTMMIATSIVMLSSGMTVLADDSGTLNGDVTWSYSDSNQTLTISGHGTIPGDTNNNYYSNEWSSFYSDIKKSCN